MQKIWRFFSNAVLLLLVVGVLGAVGLVIARESLMWHGVRTFKNDIRALRKLNGSSDCNALSGAVAMGEQESRQLRFSSSSEYALEIVCPSFPEDPLVSQKRSLPWLVTKLPGSAGITIVAEGESFVGLTVFADAVAMMPESVRPWLGWISRSELVGLQDGEIIAKRWDGSEPVMSATAFGTGPISSCEGFGFSCCDAQTQYGMGDAINDLPSCPANCYARCLARPLIVSWRSNPIVDWETNAVELPSGGSIELYYVVDDADTAGPWQATIDFGDGEETTFDGKEGVVEHEYLCDQELCEYTAQVVVENATGAQSAVTDIARLLVRVGTAQESTTVDEFEPVFNF